jgi:hypothetical protein
MPDTYDPMTGLPTGYDSTDSVTDPLAVQKMKAALDANQVTNKPQQMSIGEMGSNFYNNLKNYEQQLGITNLKNMIGQIPAVKAVQPSVEVPLALASSFPAALAYGYVPPGSSNEAYQQAQARSDALQYQPTNPASQQMLEDIGSAFTAAKIPPYIGHMPPARISPSDVQVLGARGINAAREIRDIPQDFASAQSRVNRVGVTGEPTLGAKLQKQAADFGDYLERQELAGKPLVSIGGLNLGDLAPSKSYAMPIGPKSSLWSEARKNLAEEMEAKGHTPEEIFAETLTTRGLDPKHWEQFIPSDAAKLTLDPSFKNRKDLTLKDVMHWPHLYTAYPWLKDYRVGFADLEGGGGEHDSNRKRITYDNKVLTDPNEAAEIIPHEPAHAIQWHENWPRGGSPSQFPRGPILSLAAGIQSLMEDPQINMPLDQAVKFATMIESQSHNFLKPDEIEKAKDLVLSGQANLVPKHRQFDWYSHLAGEQQAWLPFKLWGKTEKELKQAYPYSSDVMGMNPNQTILHKGYTPDLERMYVTSGQLHQQLRNKQAPSIAQMKAEMQAKNEAPGKEMAIKNPGGNWDDTRLDLVFRQNLLTTIPSQLSNPINRYELGPLWKERADEIGFSPQQQQQILASNSVNQWINKRLRNYIKNDLGTPKDPVRDLADQGIMHIQDLGEGYERLHPKNQEMIYKMRERQGQQREDFGKTDAGKDWENRSEYSIEPRSLREWAGENPQRMHNNPGFQKALERDSEAKLNLFDSGAIRDLGFDHLTDELRNAVDSTTDLPQHLRLSTKDLERMTVPDAVRHVAKINKYRADLAEKATVKNLGEFRQNFPALKTYDNGMAWHELKMPYTQPNEPLPEGFYVRKFDRYDTDLRTGKDIKREIYQVVNGRGADMDRYTDEMSTPEEAIADYNRLKNIDVLDKALKEEGELMGHCVGGYTNEVANLDSRIFTLRDAKGKPHVTIETTPARNTTTEGNSLNDPVHIKQIKGKSNKEVSPKYRAEVIDFLNNHPFTEIEDAHDLWNIGAVDTSRINSIAGGKEIDANIRAAVPDLPRFISKDLWDQLVNQHYIKKPRELAKKSSDEKAEPSKDYVDIAKRRLFGLSLGPKQDHLPAVVNPETPSSSPTSTELTTPSAPTTPSEPLKTISPLDYAAQALANMPMTRRQILKTPVNAAISHVGRGLIGNPVKAVSGMLKKEAINHAVDHVISTLWGYGHPAFGDTIDNETRQDIANQLTHAGLSEATSKPAEHFAEHFTEKDLKEAYHRSADRFNHVWSNSDIEGMANDSAREAVNDLGPDVDYEDLLDYAHSEFKKAVVNEATKTLPNSVSGEISKKVTKEILEGHGSLEDPYGTDALPDAVTKAVSDFYNEKYDSYIEELLNDEEGGGSSVSHIEAMVGAALKPLKKNLSEKEFQEIKHLHSQLKKLDDDALNEDLDSNPTAVKLKKDFLASLNKIPLKDKIHIPGKFVNYEGTLEEQYENVMGVNTKLTPIDEVEKGLRHFAEQTGQEYEPPHQLQLEEMLKNATHPQEIKNIKMMLKDYKNKDYLDLDNPPEGYKRGGHIKSLEHDRMKFELMMRGKHG